MSNKRKRYSHKRHTGYGYIMLAIAAACALVFAGLMIFKPSSGSQEVRGDYRMRYAYDDLIEVDGVSYRLRKKLTTILLLGIDRYSDTPDKEGYYNGGMADFQRLVIIDDENKEVRQLQIDRNTMVMTPVYGPFGDEIGQKLRQICYAHSFGDGREKSCELAVNALSGFLMNIPIDYYMSLRMDGINVLNDMVGGITVTLEDDFTVADPEMVKGKTITLRGKQAEYYTRRRMDVSDGTNQSRMRRQQDYISKLSAELNRRISADKNYIGQVYDALGDYMVTNMSRGGMINEAWAAHQYERPPLVSIPGTGTLNDHNNIEFVADQDAVRDIVLQLFYEPLK